VKYRFRDACLSGNESRIDGQFRAAKLSNRQDGEQVSGRLSTTTKIIIPYYRGISGTRAKKTGY
jgi:hypothetical protein